MRNTRAATEHYWAKLARAVDDGKVVGATGGCEGAGLLFREIRRCISAPTTCVLLPGIVYTAEYPPICIPDDASTYTT